MIDLRVSESNIIPLRRSLNSWCDLNWVYFIIAERKGETTDLQRYSTVLTSTECFQFSSSSLSNMCTKRAKTCTFFLFFLRWLLLWDNKHHGDSFLHNGFIKTWMRPVLCDSLFNKLYRTNQLNTQSVLLAMLTLRMMLNFFFCSILCEIF